MLACKGSVPVAVALMLLALPAAAQANGPCGQDATGASACQLAFPSTSSGTLTTDNENDYYVFSAQAGTEIFATVTDTEPASCNYNCGYVSAALYDANGDEIYEAATGDSSPNNGINVPQTFRYTIGASGTYYLIINGGLGSNNYGNPTDVPYTLQVSSESSPCGYSFPTAGCSINSPATATGTLMTDNQSDYYAMYVQANTEMSATVTDTEPASCNYNCGFVSAALYDASGDEIYEAATGDSSPNNGINVPQTFSYTVASAGVYYVEVDGGLGEDANGNPTNVPYTLQVSASPNVTWPPPAPPAPAPAAPAPPAPAPTPTTPAPTAPSPKRSSPELLLGAVHRSGHRVSLTVNVSRGVGTLSATAISGHRHRGVRVRVHGKKYSLSMRLPRGRWTVRVRFAGAAGWLTGTLRIPVRIP